MTRPCQPWADEAGVRACCGNLPQDSEVPVWIGVASSILFRMSGRQFPGICEAVVRPCDVDCGCGCHTFWEPLYRRGRRACCCSPTVTLDPWPVVGITQVLIDGEEIPESEWRLEQGRILRRLADADGRNEGWPCSQRLDLASSEENTFEVTYTWGEAPPAAAVAAAEALACHLALACAGEACLLPDRVVSLARQGVGMNLVDPVSIMLSEGRTGLVTVDLFLAAANPARLLRRPSVASPDLCRPVRVNPVGS